MIITSLSQFRTKFVGKVFTLRELEEITGADLSEWKIYYALSRKLALESFASGRANYIWLQKLLCAASGSYWAYGGQGKKHPDFYMGADRCETKSYDLAAAYDALVFVAASSFFASNCKVQPHKRLLEESPDQAKRYLFEHSYDCNDYYLLTSTRNLNCNFEDLEMIFVKTDTLKECLDPKSHYKKVDMSELRKRVTRL